MHMRAGGYEAFVPKTKTSDSFRGIQKFWITYSCFSGTNANDKQSENFKSNFNA